jgi:3-oxoacyl-[acyl-carrier-protein] synthase II
MAMAGLEAWAPEIACAGAFFGGSTAAMAEAELFYHRLKDRDQGRPWLAALAAHQLNGPGDEVARRLGLGGPVESFSAACASGGMALGAALDALRDGEVEVALAGGSDALCQLTYAGFNALRAVDPERCRPFRGERQGLNIGEGAGVVVMERRSHARLRGARELAVVLGAGATCDAHHMTAPHPRGEGASRAILRALEDAGVPAEAVDFVNAHGTGTPQNDVAEWAALERIFGARAASLPVTSTKGSVGHLLGSSGAIEAVATIACLLAGRVHPTPGEGPVDPALGVDLVLGEPRSVGASAVAVSTSFAFGGANAALVLASAGHPGGAGERKS